MDFTVTESGMQFGPYARENVFPVEETELYGKFSDKGVKCCEFLLRRGDKLFLIEAKATCPRESSLEDYQTYIREIETKMRHSLSLYASIRLGRYPGAEELPELTEKIQPLLVVRKAETAWLIPLQEKLGKELNPFRLIWRTEPVLVINEETARRKRFIS